ncbi:hypothetical protein FG062_14150 [Vibrio cholerae]|nr:hypothetical protein [Vibrio cholerae]EGR0600757.1 hypothetical protein [Vibrio cholerae]
MAGNVSHGLNEEQRLSLESGEFIHTIANLLTNKNIKIDNIDEHRRKLIAEISEALRSSNVADADAQLLLAEGFNLSEYPRYAWIDLANRIICASDMNTPISELIKSVRNSTHPRGENQMKVDIEKAKQELLSDEKLKLPKWVIFISLMSSLTTKPIAILAYLPIFASVIQTLSGVEFNLLDSLFAVLTSMCLLVLLTSTKMKEMNKDGVLDLYLALIFEKETFPKFLKSKFQKDQS